MTGPSMHGAASLVLPVDRDGPPAVLRLRLLDTETEGEPAAPGAWAGEGAVRLLEHDSATGTMLLERADEARHLSALGSGEPRERYGSWRTCPPASSPSPPRPGSGPSPASPSVWCPPPPRPRPGCRVPQNGLWDIGDGAPALDAGQVSIARTLLARPA